MLLRKGMHLTIGLTVRVSQKGHQGVHTVPYWPQFCELVLESGNVKVNKDKVCPYAPS